jgi:hypothetical protein
MEIASHKKGSEAEKFKNGPRRSVKILNDISPPIQIAVTPTSIRLEMKFLSLEKHALLMTEGTTSKSFSNKKTLEVA